MTREEAKEMLPIIQAWADGKIIQVREKGRWVELCIDDFTRSPDRYRIKPEPKYRPFKTHGECWNEMLKHQPFGWVEVRTTRLYTLIIAVDKTNVVIPNSIVKFDMAFEDFKFIDGTPFGIKEE